jgi:hypothetical protein
MFRLLLNLIIHCPGYANTQLILILILINSVCIFMLFLLIYFNIVFQEYRPTICSPKCDKAM